MVFVDAPKLGIHKFPPRMVDAVVTPINCRAADDKYTQERLTTTASTELYTSNNITSYKGKHAIVLFWSSQSSNHN